MADAASPPRRVQGERHAGTSQAGRARAEATGDRQAPRREVELQAQEGEPLEQEYIVFHCKAQSVKTLCTLLPCMRGDNKDQVVVLTISASSILFMVEDPGKCLQATALLDAADHFDDFEVVFPAGGKPQEQVEVGVNLKALVESLMIFGAASIGNTSLTMSYTSAEPDTFQVVLEEDGVVTECALQTQVCWDHDVNYNQLFLDAPTQNQLIIKSAYLKDVFLEVADNPEATCLEMSLAQSAPYFRLTARGTLMTCEVDFTDKTEPFVSFECIKPQTQVYQLPFLRMTFRALAVAANTFIRMNEQGMLCVQHTIAHRPELGDQKESVLAFVIFPRDTGVDAEDSDRDRGSGEEEEEEAVAAAAAVAGHGDGHDDDDDDDDDE